MDHLDHRGDCAFDPNFRSRGGATVKPVDLGRKMKGFGMMGAPMPSMPDEEESTIIYPCLHIDQVPDDLLQMPDEGTATIKYTIKEKTEGERGNRMELEILSIQPQGSPKMESLAEDDDASKRIDEYMEDDDEE